MPCGTKLPRCGARPPRRPPAWRRSPRSGSWVRLWATRMRLCEVRPPRRWGRWGKLGCSRRCRPWNDLPKKTVPCRVEAAGQDPRLELLARSLRQAGRQQATRAFLALGLLQGFASTSLAVENLGSRDPAQLANALESLESLRPRALVGPLIGLWDSAGRISAAGETSSDSLPESLRMLLAGGDPWLRARAALAAGGPDGPPRVG